MNDSRLLRGLGILFLAASTLLGAAEGQGRAIPRSIPSLTEPGQELAIRDVAPETGFVTFAASPGRGILLASPVGTSAENRAMAFIESYGAAFGVTRAQVRLLRATPMDSLGFEHVRLQQIQQGVPVRGGELVVHLKGSRVMAANGHTTADLPLQLAPQFPASIARDEARRLLEKHQPEVAAGARYSEPRLEIFNRGLLSEPGRHRSRLAWFIEAKGPFLRQFIWVDARSGAILLSISQLMDAKSRLVYTANHTSTLPGTLVRSEGGPATGDADQDNAYTFAGVTYDHYLNNYGRDSYDDAGAAMISTTHYCEDDCPSFDNAFWDGSQLVYGDSYSSADDVVAHELTHAVTERSSNLLYYYQSGALNESYSDIFGETVDLTDGLGNDDAGMRWRMGEDLPIGAIRHMMTPSTFGDPGKMSDPSFVCNESGWDDPFGDSGGVHSNSGVPNHAYALMVDGGTYNTKTITGIGLTKAAQIQYRALTSYLISGSNFIDNYHALLQSCTDLIGTVGIAAADCTQVQNALLAVEMNATWGCSGAVAAPAMCTSGTVNALAAEGFESGFGNWTATNSAGIWDVTDLFAKGGLFSQWGDDAGSITDIRLTMTSAVTVPAGGRFYFDHAHEFESDGGSHYDGGVLEYSTNGGSVWNDAASLIDGGRAYTGVLSSCCSNPLAGRSAFTKTSFGFTGTRLNLASLAGQNIKFRFRIGTDSSIGTAGWFVDNVSLYTCATAAVFTDDPLVAQVTRIKTIHVTELRTRIDALRVAHGLQAFSWTDSTLTAGASRIKAVHVTEMRTALSQAYVAAGSGSGPSYTDPSLSSGTAVKKVHIEQLRAGVIALE